LTVKAKGIDIILAVTVAVGGVVLLQEHIVAIRKILNVLRHKRKPIIPSFLYKILKMFKN